MFDKIDDVTNDMNSIYYKYEIKNNVFQIILFLFIFFITIFLSFYKYKKVIIVSGQVLNNNVMLYIKQDQVNAIANKKMYINNKLYKYEILKINKEVYIIDNEKVKEVVLKTELKENNIDNNVLTILFEIEETTIMRELYLKIKKGILNG